MQAYEFYATPENGFIPIPEQYRNRITRGIKVIVLDDWSGKLGHEEIDHNKTDLLLPPSLDTRGWKFNKEEANDMQDGQVVEKNLQILNPFRLYDSESVSKR